MEYLFLFAHTTSRDTAQDSALMSALGALGAAVLDIFKLHNRELAAVFGCLFLIFMVGYVVVRLVARSRRQTLE